MECFAVEISRANPEIYPENFLKVKIPGFKAVGMTDEILEDPLTWFHEFTELILWELIPEAGKPFDLGAVIPEWENAYTSWPHMLTALIFGSYIAEYITETREGFLIVSYSYRSPKEWEEALFGRLRNAESLPCRS